MEMFKSLYGVENLVWSSDGPATARRWGHIIRYAKKNKEAADLPSIWLTEGRFMLDCGKRM